MNVRYRCRDTVAISAIPVTGYRFPSNAAVKSARVFVPSKLTRSVEHCSLPETSCNTIVCERSWGNPAGKTETLRSAFHLPIIGLGARSRAMINIAFVAIYIGEHYLRS